MNFKILLFVIFAFCLFAVDSDRKPLKCWEVRGLAHSQTSSAQHITLRQNDEFVHAIQDKDSGTEDATTSGDWYNSAAYARRLQHTVVASTFCRTSKPRTIASFHTRLRFVFDSLYSARQVDGFPRLLITECRRDPRLCSQFA